MRRSRELFAGFIGATGDDIALTGATSYAMAVAAANIRIPPGRTIVMLEAQFPSNYYVWQRVAVRDGAQVLIVPRPSDGDWTSAVPDRLGDRKSVVEGKSVSVLVDLGGRPIIKKKQSNNHRQKK